MPPRSPLPPRHGLRAAWVCTPEAGRPPVPATPTMGAWLRARLDPRADVDALLAGGRFVRQDGSVVRDEDAYAPHTFVFFHRDLREEPVVPGVLRVLHRDERLVVVDKPPFLATVPRGRHVLQSVVVRLRAELDLPDLTPVHRLDRVTSGVLVLTTQPRWRAPYQRLLERGEVTKTYLALAPWRPDRDLPVVVRDHVAPVPGTGLARVVPGAPVNAETHVALEEHDGATARYRLTPRTGRTHQLRLHLWGLGVPILGDPLYPVVRDVDVDDHTTPLQLLAAEVAFVDPVDGRPQRFASERRLPVSAED